MWYVIYAKDRDNSLDARLSARAEHLARMQMLIEQGRVLVAGPMPAIDSETPGPAGFIGSTIIAEFGSLEEAERWASQDPYVKAGVYEKVEVHPFLRVLP